METTGKHLHSSLFVAMDGWLARLWQSLPRLRMRKAVRHLRLCESLPLGEKRLIAVVEYERQKFLIGGGAQSVCLLARLGEGANFSELLTEWCERQR